MKREPYHRGHTDKKPKTDIFLTRKDRDNLRKHSPEDSMDDFFGAVPRVQYTPGGKMRVVAAKRKK